MPDATPQHCYVVLHHKDAPPHEQYENRWLDSWRIEEILTEPWVAEKCQQAGVVYIYRSRWRDWPPCIACEAEVEGVSEAVAGSGSKLIRVRFKNARKLNEVPPFKALSGDICKLAGPPPSGNLKR